MKLGPPAEGEVVQVKWPDGKLYGAKYLGSNVAYMYQVGAAFSALLVEIEHATSKSQMHLGYLIFYEDDRD